MPSVKRVLPMAAEETRAQATCALQIYDDSIDCGLCCGWGSKASAAPLSPPLGAGALLDYDCGH